MLSDCIRERLSLELKADAVSIWLRLLNLYLFKHLFFIKKATIVLGSFKEHNPCILRHGSIPCISIEYRLCGCEKLFDISLWFYSYGDDYPILQRSYMNTAYTEGFSTAQVMFQNIGAHNQFRCL